MSKTLFYLYGKDSKSARPVDLSQLKDAKAIRSALSKEFSIAVPHTISFHREPSKETLPSDLVSISDEELLKLGDEKVALLVSGKQVRDVPGPTGLPLIGGYSEIYPDFLGNYQRLLDHYGHMVHVAYLGKSVYLTDDPDTANAVLTEGDFYMKNVTENHPLHALKLTVPLGLFTVDSSHPAWSQSHKMIMTALSAKPMRNYVQTMDATSEKLVNVFSELKCDGKPFNVFPFMLKAAAQTIGEITTGVDFKMLENLHSEIAEVFHAIGENLKLSQALFRKGSFYRALPNPEARGQKKIMDFQQRFLDESVANAKARGTKTMPYQEAALNTSSILEYLLVAEDEEGKKLDPEVMFQDISTMLGAGQVTTSSLLSWLMYCLSTYTDKARKLYESLLEAGLRKDKPVEVSDLSSPKLAYLDYFIKETQRLYNPAFQPTREAQKDVIMPGGYLVPKGSQVTAAIHSIHVNKEYWSDPLTFRPERWGEAEAKRNQSSKAYIPFATGARSCIGFSLALQETKIILSRVVLNFQVRNETDGQVAYDPDFSLYRPLNLMVTLHDQPDAEETLKEAEVKKDQNEDQVEVKEQSKNVSVGRKDLPTFHIVHASAGGTCEGYASELGSKLKSMGIDSKVTSLMDSPVAQFEGEVTAVIITATYNGSPPDNALDFEEILDEAIKKGDKDHFKGLNYAVFGCGNKAWAGTYQKFPKKVDANLSSLGGNRIFEKGSGDAQEDQDEDWHEWSTKFLAEIGSKNGISFEGTSSGSEGGENNSSSLAEPHSFDVKKAVKIAFHPPEETQHQVSNPEDITSVFGEDGIQLAKIKESQELVDRDSTIPRGMRLITFETKEKSDYLAGDHLMVWPENNPKDVEKVIVALGLIGEGRFTVDEIDEDNINSKSLAKKLLGLEKPISIRQALTSLADLSAPVSRVMLKRLSSFMEEGAKGRDELVEMCNSKDKEAQTTFANQNHNVVTLLSNYPALASALDFHKLIVSIPCIAPRRYSVSSSPKVEPNLIKICVGVNAIHSPQGDWKGLCSGFLERSQISQKVFVKPISSQKSFHLPQDPSVPITMVAAGTGLAPFLGFLEDRRADNIKIASKGGKGSAKLYYGTSSHDMSELRSLVHSYVEDGTVEVSVIYSDEVEAGDRRYAQHLLQKDALSIWSDLRKGGHIYVCGSGARLGAGVQSSLRNIAEQVGGETEPDAFLSSLRSKGVFSEDIFN